MEEYIKGQEKEDEKVRKKERRKEITNKKNINKPTTQRKIKWIDCCNERKEKERKIRCETAKHKKKGQNK
jgi:hypothetical protein